MTYEENVHVKDETLRQQPTLQTLNDNGIQARPVWTLLHKLPMYKDCPKMDLTTAKSLEARLINIPSSVGI